MTLKEVATVMVEQTGAKYAINLDGGSSSTMVIDGKIMNRPSCLHVLPIKCERPVATVVCVDSPVTTTTSTTTTNNNNINVGRAPEDEATSAPAKDLLDDSNNDKDFVVNTLTAGKSKNNTP